MTSTMHNGNGVSLRQYLENMVEAYKEAHAEQHRLLDQAVTHTREAMEYRLEGMNEFRAQMQDERTHLVGIDKFDALEKRITAMEKNISSLNGRIAGGAAVLAVVFTLVQIALRLVKP